MSEPPPTGDSSATFDTKPWPEFFDVNSLSLPVSFSDASTRLNFNLSHFRINYINIFLVIFFLTLALRPLSLLFVFGASLAWYFIYFNPRTSPLEILGFVVDDRFLFGFCALITLIALFLAHAWSNLLWSIVISGVVVLLHGVLRVPNFGDHNPYGGLLDAETGAYSEF
ncbi:PRA1 family protein D [Bienertia sinuspersici]